MDRASASRDADSVFGAAAIFFSIAAFRDSAMFRRAEIYVWTKCSARAVVIASTAGSASVTASEANTASGAGNHRITYASPTRVSVPGPSA